MQPGVPRSRLNAAAGQHGLWFPVDPGADASLGGMAATNASGTTTSATAACGRTSSPSKSCSATGAIRPGSHAVKTSAGYDLRALFVGSEGTLGVITELTCACTGCPSTRSACGPRSPPSAAACRAATAIVGAGGAATG